MTDEWLDRRLRELAGWLDDDGRQKRSWGFWILLGCAVAPVALIVARVVFADVEFRQAVGLLAVGGYVGLVMVGVALRADGARKTDVARRLGEVLDAGDDDD